MHRFIASCLVASLAACGGLANHPPEKPVMSSSAMPVTWFSIPAADIDRAGAFYEQAFGWKLEPTTRESDAKFDYRVAVSSPGNEQYEPNRKGRINGCIVKRETGLSTPAVLVEVDDLDAAAKKVVAAGGSIASAKIPMRSLGGEFVLVRDPDGNLLELFRSAR